MAELLIVIVTTVTVGLFIASLGASLRQRRQEESRSETTEQRINRLTTALSEAARVIEEVETEIREKHGVVEKLREDVQTYERLRNVNKTELEAVAQVLGGELKREGRRSFWTNAAMNFGFFVLGAVVSVATTLAIG